MILGIHLITGDSLPTIIPTHGIIRITTIHTGIMPFRTGDMDACRITDGADIHTTIL